MKRRDKDWQISEDYAVKIYGGKLVPGSGNGDDNKLDIVIEEGPAAGHRIENKFTIRESYSLKKETLNKAFRQAAMTGDKYILRVDFDSNIRGVFMDENTFLNILNRED